MWSSGVHSRAPQRRETPLSPHVLPLRPLQQPTHPRQLLRDGERRLLLRDLPGRGEGRHQAVPREVRAPAVHERRGEDRQPEDVLQRAGQLQHDVRDGAGEHPRRQSEAGFRSRPRGELGVLQGSLPVHPEPDGGVERFGERGRAARFAQIHASEAG